MHLMVRLTKALKQHHDNQHAAFALVFCGLTFIETPQAQGSEVGSFHDYGTKEILTLNK